MAAPSSLADKIPLQSGRSSLCCAYLQSLESFSFSQPHWRKNISNKLNLKRINFSRKTVYRPKQVSAYCPEDARSINQESVQVGVDSYEEWDSLTAKFAGASNLPFLLLQLPQIILNSRNLMAGNNSALLAVPWLGMFAGLLGNLSLLSYFIKKRETEAVVVQMLGVVSTYVVILQLAMAEAMPLPHFIATSIVIAFGLLVNFMKYFRFLNRKIWHFWEEFITIAGLCALPQVMWSTFVPYIPNTILPALIAFVTSLVSVLMVRRGKLSKKSVNFLGLLSGWTATLLFMWMPVAQMWTSILNPENVKGLSSATMLLAMIGNGLMIPRALFIRDLMWFTGSTWATVFYGWGNLVCLYWFNCISREFFLTSTFGFLSWIGITFWRDGQVHGYSSPFASLKDLIPGS